MTLYRVHRVYQPIESGNPCTRINRTIDLNKLTVCGLHLILFHFICFKSSWAISQKQQQALSLNSVYYVIHQLMEYFQYIYFEIRFYYNRLIAHHQSWLLILCFCAGKSRLECHVQMVTYDWRYRIRNGCRHVLFLVYKILKNQERPKHRWYRPASFKPETHLYDHMFFFVRF